MSIKILIHPGHDIQQCSLCCIPVGEPEELRLVGGATDCEGRVEVKHRGEWGTVCGHDWGLEEATVVCRQLGCNSSLIKAFSFGAGSGKIWLGHPRCTGIETALWKCNHRMWGRHYCAHHEDVGVVCAGRMRHKVQSFLFFLHSYYINYSSVTVANTPVLPVQGNSALYFYYFKALSFFSLSRTDTLLMYIFSQFSGEPEDVRLVGGSTRCEGRVEVKHRGTWGTVCNDGWNNNAAKTVCKQLGCKPLHDPVHNIYFGAGEGRIWLICRHNQEIGVICAGWKLVILNFKNDDIFSLEEQIVDLNSFKYGTHRQHSADRVWHTNTCSIGQAEYGKRRAVAWPPLHERDWELGFTAQCLHLVGTEEINHTQFQ
uniref:SRCR domain-containing protein n=1 Tax=Xenopus tropicalis TaxID=8364 RepID=A0A6I8RKP4_XENTR